MSTASTDPPMRQYSLSDQNRHHLVKRLIRELTGDSSISFAYLFGSSLDASSVHDIDVGVYLRGTEPHAYSAALSSRLSKALGLPVDVRVLNDAPTTFLYHVVRGKLLVVHDENLLTSLIEDVSRRYLDIEPLLRQATKDAFAA